MNPMTRLTFFESYDTFGQLQQQTTIACPRDWRSFGDTASEPFLATRGVTEYAVPIDPDSYIYDRVAKTTSLEIVNDGTLTIEQLLDLGGNDPALRLIGQALYFYDGEAFTGLTNGEVGAYGALVRTENLVLTEEILEAAYAGHGSGALPPYFDTTGSPAWPEEYPDSFVADLTERSTVDPTRPELKITPVGYGFAEGDDQSAYSRGYYVTSRRQKLDFQVDGSGRGLAVTIRNPIAIHNERDSLITYDRFELLPTEVTNPAGLSTEARYDYRTLKPIEVTDVNGNRTVLGYSPLGLTSWIAVMGKEGETPGRHDGYPG